MRRSGGTGDSVDVELVDVDAVPGDEEPVGSPPDDVPSGHPLTDPVRPPGPRRARRRGLVVAAVALLVVAGVNVVQLAQDAAERARWAEVPGVMAAMPAAPQERWRVTSSGLSDQAGDMVLLGGGPGSGQLLDAATGEVVLELATPSTAMSGWCRLLREGTPWTYDVLAPASGTIVCQSAEWVGETPPVTTLVQVHDVASGRVASIELPGQVVLEQLHEGDLVLASEDTEGYVETVRWDPLTGERRWTHRAQLSPGLAEGGTDVYGEVVDDMVVLHGPDGVSGLSAADGSELAAVPVERRDLVLRRLSDGRVLRLTRGDGPDDGPRVQVVEADGDVTMEVEGYPPIGQVVDPAVDVLMLYAMPSGRLTARAAADGAELWTVEGSQARLLLHLGDVVLLVDGDELVARDAHNGEPLWTHPVRSDLLGTAMTDGARVLVAVAADDGPELVALGVRSGREAWRTALPMGTVMLSPAPSGVLVQTHGEVVLLGRP